MRRASCLFFFLLAACGGAPPPEPQSADTSKEPPKEPERHKLAMTQELGSIDPGQVQKTWNALGRDFDACRKAGQGRIEVLHGDAKFFVRLGPDGNVKWTYLEDSTLGDRETEKCLLDAVTRARWPKPDGGDAEVRNSVGFDPDGRPPASWSTDKIAAVLGKKDKDLTKCKEGVKDPIHVTLYVGPHHKEGRVLSVGASSASKDASAKLDCIAEEVKSWKLPSPGSWTAKVDFRM